MNEEMIIRLSIEGTTMVLRGAKEVLAALVAVLKYAAQHNIPSMKLKDFLSNTTNARFLSVKNEDAELFKSKAKNFGLRYIHLKDTDQDGASTLMLRGEDAAIINRILESNGIKAIGDLTNEDIAQNPSRAAEVNEQVVDVTIGKEGVTVRDVAEQAKEGVGPLIHAVDAGDRANPTRARTDQSAPSVPSLKVSGTPEEAEKQWNDVTASIEQDFSNMVAEAQKHRFELYDQTDPLLSSEGTAGTKQALPIQPKPSMRKNIAHKTELSKQQKVAAAQKLRRERTNSFGHSSKPVPAPRLSK